MTIEPAHSPFPIRSQRIAHGFFSRVGGVSSGIYRGLNCGPGSDDDPNKVRENRNQAAQSLGTTENRLLSLYQIHSAEVVTVTEPWTRENAPQADAMVTTVPGLALGILTADCGPVLFWDEEAGVIGAAHAGWKGALTGVIEATTTAMIAKGADRTRIAATLGPTISQAAYEVGPVFKSRFIEEDQDYAHFFKPSTKPNHAMFDLPGFILKKLQDAQIGNRTWLGHCTYNDPTLYYSYRRTTHLGEADYGRNLSAVMLRPSP